MRRSILLTLCSLALVAAGCGGTSTASLSSNDAAVVGSQAITKDEFQGLMDRAKASYDTQKKPFPKPGTTAYEQLKGQAVFAKVLYVSAKTVQSWEQGVRVPSKASRTPLVKLMIALGCHP